jgi:Zn-dependent peptidase ImmA (M78 family)
MYLSEFFIKNEPAKILANKIRNETVGDSIPVDIEKICKKNDNPIIFEDMDVDTWGKTDLRDEKFVIIINKSIKKSIGRKHYTMAHELGHIIFETHHIQEYKKASVDRKNPNWEYISKKFEHEANEFASYLLIPEIPFRDDVKRLHNLDGWEQITQLCIKYQTSLESLVIRYIQLSNEVCCFISYDMNKKHIKTLCYTEEFRTSGLFIDRKSFTIPQMSNAFSLDKEKKVNDVKSRLPITYWFPKSNKNGKLVEHSFIYSNYIYCLIILKEELDLRYSFI